MRNMPRPSTAAWLRIVLTATRSMDPAPYLNLLQRLCHAATTHKNLLVTLTRIATGATGQVNVGIIDSGPMSQVTGDGCVNR